MLEFALGVWTGVAILLGIAICLLLVKWVLRLLDDL